MFFFIDLKIKGSGYNIDRVSNRSLNFTSFEFRHIVIECSVLSRDSMEWVKRRQARRND